MDLEDIIRYISRHTLYSVHQLHAEKSDLNLKSFRNLPVFKVIYYQGDESTKEVNEVASVLIDSFEETGLNPPGDPRSFFLPEGYRSFSSPQNPRIFPFLLGSSSAERWSATALNVYYPLQQGDSVIYVPEGLVLLSPFNCLEKLHDRLVAFLVKSYSILHDSPRGEKASILKQLLRRDMNGDEKRRYSAAVFASTEIPASPEMKPRDPPMALSNQGRVDVYNGHVRESVGDSLIKESMGTATINASTNTTTNASTDTTTNASTNATTNASTNATTNALTNTPTIESSTAQNNHDLPPNPSFVLEERERFLNPYQDETLSHKPPFLPWNPSSLRIFPLSSFSENDPVSSFHRHLRSADVLRPKVPRHGMRFLFKVLSVQHVLLLIRLLLLEKSILCVSTQYSLLTAVMEALKETL